MPAIADGAVWEKVTKGRAGIRWNSVVENVWKDIEGNQEQVLSIDTSGVYKTTVKEMIERRERLALRAKVKEGEHLRDIRGERVREEIGITSYWHVPMDYAKTLNLQFRVGDLDLPERRKTYASSREEEDAQMCPCGKAIRVELIYLENVKVQGGTGCGIGDEENRRMWHGEVWYTRM